MKAGDRQRLLALFSAMADGRIEAAEHAELVRALSTDAEARRLWFVFQDLEVALHTRMTPPATALPVASPARLSWAPVAVAAALAVAALVVLFLSRPEARRDAPAVGTLVLTQGCTWEGAPLREGQRLHAGWLTLRAGTAVVRLDGGAALMLQAGSELELRSRSQARLRAGSVLVRAEEQAAGFVLETPASEVTDLGTEFAVQVEPSGATEVHVLEGLVSYRKTAQAPESAGSELLGAGRAIRYDEPGQAEPRMVALKSARFADTVRTLAGAGEASALLAHEPFAYSGDELPLAQATGGDGWRGGWHPAQTWPIPTDPLRPLRLGATHGRGRLLDASDRFPQIARDLATPIRLDRDGIYYLSALVRWVPGTSPVPQMRQVRLVLRNRADPKHARYVLNLPKCLRPQIQRHDFEVFTSREKVAAGELQRWVVKIIAREHGDDELHFRIFGETETTGPMEPDQWHLSLTAEHSDAVLDQLYLDTYLAPDPTAFGDLRLGTTWHSVTRP